MRPVSVTGIFLTLLLASVLSLAFLSARYVFSVREYRRLQSELVAAENNRSRMRMLVADCLEYRKRNPAIDAVLLSANLLRAPGTNAPARTP
jgi:hypothetical protein